jgi:threonine aldolase
MNVVTQPTEAMRKVMAEAPVRDDIYREDPSVNLLEQSVAKLCGKEVGLFVCSGTMSNQLALNAHLQQFQSVLCASDAHIYQNESTALAHLSQALLIPVEPDPTFGYLTVERVLPHLRLIEDVHFTQTTVISLEIPSSGMIMPIEELQQFRNLANKYRLKIHLDGARLWNAAVAEHRSLDDYCQYADTVCLSHSILLHM